VRIVIQVPEEPGLIELNFMWMPTVFGMNVRLQAQLKEKLGKAFLGKAITEEGLDEMSEVVISTLVEMHPMIKGLRQYLESMKYLDDSGLYGNQPEPNGPPVPSDQA
jgi:hypothetical protein